MKQGQVTQEEYAFFASPCRDRIRKASRNLELNLAKNVNGNKKKYVSNKRKD